ncbi:MAG TPA: flavodoxin family protein [Dehalococcoidia bacterium]|nr:flavodoxin family protein [Dehalococcoidia bacterium]
MKVLGVMGSPRIGSNTDSLLDKALDGAREHNVDIEKLVIDKLKISPCKEYYGCKLTGECVIDDDMREIYPKLIEADCVIVASPIFFYGISAQLKAVIDRCQALWCRKHVLKQEMPNSNRNGALIAVGATKGKKLFNGVVLTIRYFFDAIGVKFADELLIRGVDNKGEINEHPEALTAAYELGKRLVVE